MSTQNFAIEYLKLELSELGLLLKYRKKQESSLRRVLADLREFSDEEYQRYLSCSKIDYIEDRGLSEVCAIDSKRGNDIVSKKPQSREDRFFCLLAQRLTLEQDLQHGRELEDFYNGLMEILSPMEKEIIRILWIDQKKGGARYLSSYYHYSQSRIYSISDEALNRLIRARFGLKGVAGTVDYKSRSKLT